MATTSPDGLYSPNEDTPVDFVADWAASMSSVQTALTNRGTKIGTTAQREAATGVREGTLWFDTTTQSFYLYSGGGWSATGTSDSGVVSNPSTTMSLFSGVTSTGFAARRSGGLVSLSMSCSGTFTGSGTGANIGQLYAGWRPAVTAATGPAYFSSSGYLQGLVRVSTSGTIQVWKENAASRGAVSFTLTFPYA